MSQLKKIVVFTGAGMSAESGINTFRDSGGLWEQHKIEDVATPQAWQRNQGRVLDFYNQRRKQVITARPNEGHIALARLQDMYDVEIITQNVDDLHERAGSKKVLHLHGEIMKVRSSVDENLVYPVHKDEIYLGDTCEKGSQLRPHIVWFGELVTEMDRALAITSQADVFIVIGTSLQVYPAAGLLHAAPIHVPKYLVDPGAFEPYLLDGVTHIKKKASAGLQDLLQLLK